METASVATCQGHGVSMANHVMACCYSVSLTYVCHPFAQLISLWYFYFVSAQSVGGSTFLLFPFFFACVLSQHTHCFRFYYCRPWKRWRSMVTFQILKALNYWIVSCRVFKHCTEILFCYISKIYTSLLFSEKYLSKINSAKYANTVSCPKIYIFPLIQFLFLFYFQWWLVIRYLRLRNPVRTLSHVFLKSNFLATAKAVAKGGGGDPQDFIPLRNFC